MKKRILAVLLSAVMALSLGACGDSNNGNTEKDNGKDVKQPSITKLADYKDFSAILTGEYEVTDEKVEAYFSNVVYDAGVGLLEVKDRDIVQAGDIVKVDYTGYVDGKPFNGGSTIIDGVSYAAYIDVSNNSSIDPATGGLEARFQTGFSDALTGAKKGVDISGKITFPKGYGKTTFNDGDKNSENDVEVDLSLKEATFVFNVKGIYRELTSENITDAIIADKFKEAYNVSTVAEFMKMMRKELAYNLVMNYVVENSTFDIAGDYLNLRLDEYQKFFTELYCVNMDLATFLAYNGTTVDAMRAQWASVLQSQIKAELVFAAIVKDAGLKVNEEELAAYVADVMKIASGANGNPFYAKEENIYRAKGAGNATAGKAILLNQSAVGDYIMENYQ